MLWSVDAVATTWTGNRGDVIRGVKLNRTVRKKRGLLPVAFRRAPSLRGDMLSLFRDRAAQEGDQEQQQRRKCGEEGEDVEVGQRQR
jgi:hypothetical protein